MSDPSTAVSAAPLVADALPYVQSLAAAAITALVGVGVALIKKYVGVQIDSATVAMVDSYIENLAAAEVAKAADNLATAQINIGSPIVKALVDEVGGALPAELKSLNLGPGDVAAKVTAAFGRLQASMTAAPVVTSPMLTTVTSPTSPMPTTLAK